MTWIAKKTWPAAILAIALGGGNVRNSLGDDTGADPGTTIRHAAVERLPGGQIRLEVRCPAGFTNRLDIFACTSLASQDWVRVCTTGVVAGLNPAVFWTDPDSPSRRAVFYQAWNADIDSDSDGLPDGREVRIHKSSPASGDSDGNGLPDGWEWGFFGSATGADAQGDADGDGWTQRDEYRRGGHPKAAFRPDTAEQMKLKVVTPLR